MQWTLVSMQNHLLTSYTLMLDGYQVPLGNVRLDNSSDQTPFLLSSPTHKDSSGNQT